MPSTEGDRIIVRREPLTEKQCPSCGKLFPALARQMYCSIRCANRASYHRHIERRRADRRERYWRQKGERT